MATIKRWKREDVSTFNIKTDVTDRSMCQCARSHRTAVNKSPGCKKARKEDIISAHWKLLVFANKTYPD